MPRSALPFALALILSLAAAPALGGAFTPDATQPVVTFPILEPGACRACHGNNGEGSVLSRMADTRTLKCDEEGLPGCGNDERITLTRGTEVSCDLCHENELD